MRKSIQKFSVLLLALLLIVGMIPASAMAAGNPSVSYRTHVQNEGWQGFVSDGTMSGTSGKGLRLEGIEVKLDNQGYDLGISYQTHIENIGWESDTSRGWKSNGIMSGTSGLGYRLEAIQLKLTGADADKFDIYYQVHAQNIGWMGWAKNGESAGTAGFGYRLEGINIKIVPAGSAAPGSTENAFQKYVAPQYRQAYRDLVNQAYQEFVATYPPGSYGGSAEFACPYSLFDIDSNGIPELLIEKGNIEANYTYYIYTYENGQAKFMGTTNGSHSTLFGKTNATSGELLLRKAHMGHHQVFEINYINGSITTNMVLNEVVPDGVPYFKTDYPVPFAYARDLSLLN